MLALDEFVFKLGHKIVPKRIVKDSENQQYHPKKFLPVSYRLTCGQEVLCMLLEEPEIQRSRLLSDAVLDLQTELLRTEADGRAILYAFLEMRRAFGNRFYLLFYRLRGWLENHLSIQCSDKGREMTIPLDARFRCLEQIERRARLLFFEHDLQVDDPNDVRLNFLFNTLPAEIMKA